MSAVRIAILDDWSQVYVDSPLRQELGRYGHVEVFTDRLTDEDAIARRLEPFQILVPFRERTRFTAGLLERLPNLRLIAQTGTGVAHIDVAAATRLGIPICVTPGGSAVSVAEHILGMMLSLAHKLDEGDRAMRRGDWPLLIGQDLNGKTLGILGMGAIAQELAPRAKALGMRVVAWSPSLTPERAAVYGAEHAPFEDMLRQAQFFSVNVRLNAETRGMIGQRELGLLPRGAILINTARGPIVDEAAMLAALDSGQLAAAGLDVFDEEPLPTDHPLRSHPKVLLTPHTGHTTQDTYDNFLQGAIGNIAAFLEGRPVNVKNPDSLQQSR